MADRKTRNFLPTVFQTDTNEKFLSATMDQLISEPTLTSLYGYVGRKFAPTYKTGDSYLRESSTDRQNYQLEASTVVKDDQNDVTFFSNYVDYINKIKNLGGITDNHNRLFASEYYSYDTLISLDKFVNFSQYYWLPNGPDAVDVDTTGVDLIRTYNVTRDSSTGTYVYSSNGIVDNSVILPRGGTYKFIIDQIGYPFWIQSELGTSGVLKAAPTISSRDVLGVENNGTDSGVITFKIPSRSAQERFTSMQTVSTVEFAAPIAYSDIHNKTLSQFITAFPEYVSLIPQLDNKQLIFVEQNLLNNRGEEIWTTPPVVTTPVDDGPGDIIPGYDAGTIVSQGQRYGVWKIQFLDIGIGDPLIRLSWVKNVAINQKVYVRYGLATANKEYYKDYDEFFYEMPLLSSLQDFLFVQDGIDSKINSTFRVVDYFDWNIDVTTDILGKLAYTSPNGVQFTSGLKILFDTSVVPTEYQNREFYVGGVGDTQTGISLVPVDELVTPEIYVQENIANSPNTVFPEYVTIDRASVDRNAWSRNNRWFHRDIISKTAEYRGEIAAFDQTNRARRPIIQFNANLQLFNQGRIAKKPIDIIDFTTVDAFTQYEGQVLSRAFGVDLVDGLRIVFANDNDQLVKNKIYVINRIQVDVDELGSPTGPKYIKLIKAVDGDVTAYDTTVVTQGQFQGQQWWFNGVQWSLAQQKTTEFQEPLFDVYNSTFDFVNKTLANGRSLGNFNRSSFAGTKLFGYLKNSAGTTDPVLGFALSYRNFGTQGDIEFKNYFDSDTFDYLDSQTNASITKNINIGFLQKINSRYDLTPTNIWTTVIEPSRQYQSIGYVYDGTSNVFAIDVTPNTQGTKPSIKVFINFKYQTSSQWILVSNQIRLTISNTFIGDGTTTAFTLPNTVSTAGGIIVIVNGVTRRSAGYYGVAGQVISFVTAPTLGDVIDIRVIDSPAIGDKIDILVYSNEVSKIGFYLPPENLDLNAQNTNVETLTLGQMRNHLVAQAQNSSIVIGDPLGVSNLHDIDISAQGGSILQHSAPLPYGELFLLDKQANFIESLRYAQREYTKFKNKFLELSASLPGIQPTDPVASVDLILAEINKTKNTSFPWFYSDMVPYGTLKNELTYIVFDPLRTDYELDTIFNDLQLSNRAVLVYVNGTQLIKDKDYTFLTDRPAVRFKITLAVDDQIKFVDYLNTNGCYIPETPTKLGLWPKWQPTTFQDNTYRVPTIVLVGHDGSITPIFGDYRDGFLLELETRIYNNIKISDTSTYKDIFAIIPGKFRKKSQPYSLLEITQLVSKSFQSWIGNNRLDFATNSAFDSNDLFTWNYGDFIDRIDGEQLSGSWRACYQYFYDTVRPHLTPWEMLGFVNKPDYWEAYYGPAPYTSGNKLLWDDLEAGIIREDSTVRIDLNYARPGLTTIIPVDENGNLIPPASLITDGYNASGAASAWAVGQQGPVEFAWRTSSDYPFAMQQAMALATPGKYFSTAIDTYNYSKYNATYNLNLRTGQIINSTTMQHVKSADIVFNGQANGKTIYRSAGYLNWITDYLTSQGINPNVKLSNLIDNYQVNLAYKLAGFTDQNYVNILAEQLSPESINDTVVIPNENYKVYLNKSTPIQKLVYSAVIIEKTNNGYSVRGYDLNNPFFTVIPSQVSGNSFTITVLNRSASIFKEFQNLKLVVPYGYEFATPQQVVDFLISYERYLLAQGFTFDNRDESLGEQRNWTLSAKEFLYWIQQGWKVGSILVVSPVANTISAISEGAITDGITDSQYGSRIVDQNFNLVKNINYEVMRGPSDFKITLTDAASVIGFVEIDLVQFEHVLIFDNITVFNDIIYKPELGNRQYRLKIVGQKTANWDGSLYAPGFIYNDGKVHPWAQGRDYLQGDIVAYKDQYYTALQNVTATTEFQFSLWKHVDSTAIRGGLLPNFSTIAAESKSYYNSYPGINSKDQVAYSHGLIGYRPRQYLEDLGLTETTQIEFYKGFIKQKGSLNSVTQLTSAEFNNISGNIDLYEEWAVRTGTYGAVTINPYVEVPLAESVFGVNPSLLTFVNEVENNLGDALTVFNKSQLIKSTDKFNGNIAFNRTDSSNYDNDILTAGYVNLDDADTTLFNITDYIELNAVLDQLGTGYLIWVAKDFNQQWNIYRVTETNNHAILITKIIDGVISFTFETPHGLNTNNIFIVKGFDTTFDGVFQVNEVVDLNTIVVSFSGDTARLEDQPLFGYGLYYVLNSMRFQYMEDSRVYGNPPNGWKVGDKIWIDTDAATTSVQGQPYTTQSGTWKVYEKTNPWVLNQSLSKSASEYDSNNGFGSSLRMSADGLTAIAGNPWAGNGSVSVFYKDYKGEYVEGTKITSILANVSSFGHTIDLATDKNNSSILAVGSPRSRGNVGYVSIYTKSSDSASYKQSQILLGQPADQFGTSIALNQDGSWLYVGAPGNDKVYLYGLDTSIPTVQAVVSAANTANVITLPFSISNTADSWGNSLVITGFSRTCLPLYDYSVFANISGNTDIRFTNTISNLFGPQAALGADLFITQQPYYVNLGNVTGNIGSGFGHAISSGFDGLQLAIGAPKDTVGVLTTTNNTTTLTNYIGAGAVFVYDRVIDAYKAVGQTSFITNVSIPSVHRVTVGGIEVTNYTITTTNISNDTVSFSTAPANGDIVYVETNQFTLLEKLIGIDNLVGGTGAIQANAFFGTSLTICSKNCAIYIGAPYYNNGDVYNTGAVWKFHNRGRLYGTNNGYTQNPVFTPGDTIRLDNFTVTVNGRLMPTATANVNILTLSGNITARAGDYITQTTTGANVTVLSSTPVVVGTKHITVSNYNNANVFTFGSGNITVGNANVSSSLGIYPMASLDSLVKDINDAGLLGISAVNENDKLRVLSDSTTAKNRLRILSGSTQSGSSGVYASADLSVFAFMQIIVNPYNKSNEFFGSKVKLASNAYMLIISSERGTTSSATLFDTHRDKLYPAAVKQNIDGSINTNYYILDPLSPTKPYSTSLDDNSTRFFDAITASGSTYIYELYDDPRDDVEHPGRYAFAQQLNPGTLNTDDKFGYAVDIVGNYVLVGAPGDDTVKTDAGSIYVFENPNRTRGWNLIRYQDQSVDIDSVSRIFLYNKLTNTILDNLQFIDPTKGKILGQADQEITYKTEYDPAIYNRGFNANADINTSIYWNNTQVGKVWWNLSSVRFVDYEQGSLLYRHTNWGKLFSGSSIEICEWVESTVLPSQYIANGGDGVPKYIDNSAYVQITFVDPITNIIGSKYYYWVKNKTSIDPNDPTRNLPTTSIANLIENPKNQGISCAAIIKNNAVIFYNIGNYLSGSDTILHIDYQLSQNSNIIHSEYALIQKGDSYNQIPTKILDKLVDSLSGIDKLGSVVPDPNLDVADKYGIDIRPRQSMFVDRVKAVNILVSHVNDILIRKPIARQYDLTKLITGADIPSIKTGLFKQTVDTDQELAYLDLGDFVVGDKVLVLSDTTQDNLWAIYELDSTKQWNIHQIQSYKTDLYWDYVDWFETKADGSKYSLEDKLDFVVPTLVDAKKLPVFTGQEILVKVAIGIYGGWNLFTVSDRLELTLVGIENGTIQLNTSLGDFANNQLGFGNQGFSSNRYDQNPDIEIRNIVEALKNDIFINELQGEFNNLFFVLVNFLLTEQKFADWLFKTSFINVKHNLRTLDQYPSYVRDNQTYYQDYINEVKPYRTKLREYLLAYSGNDTYPSTVTDFDLPPYFDLSTSIFRSPSGEKIDEDGAKWQTYPYNHWYENRKYSVATISIKSAGLGYIIPPKVDIINNTGGGGGATAAAFIDGNTGALTHITVTSGGSGYITAPTIVINGSSTVPATAYAVLKNNQVRTFDTTLKFDRISYTSSVQEWTANTSYTETRFNSNGYVTSGDVITYAQQEGNILVRLAYTVNANITTGNNFDSSQFTIYNSANIKTANDRIMGYYQPSNRMPARDLNQLVYGIEYPGVQIQGPGFNHSPLFGAGEFDVGLFDDISYDTDGTPMLSEDAVDTIIRSNYTDAALGTRAEDINVSGGGYVDTYSSHAPEEMVPGIMFDTLDMKIYSNIGGNLAGTYGYRVFSNMLNDVSYIRMSDTFSTSLTTGLSRTANTILVANASVLSIPSAATNTPGVIFVGSERITYWKNYIAETPISWGNALIVPEGTLITTGNLYITTGNVYEATGNLSNVSSNVQAISSQHVLGQIRRGTQGTAIAQSYPTGTVVSDSGIRQHIPDLDTVDVRFIALRLSGNITANIGEYIEQPSTGAVLRVITNVSGANSISVTYRDPFKVNLGQSTAGANVIIVNGAITSLYPTEVLNSVTLTKPITSNPSYVLNLTSNISANIGSFITQSTSGANATVLGYKNEFGNLVLVSYNNSAAFDFTTANIGLTSNIAINGTYTSNVFAYANGPIYPIASNVAGFIGTFDGGNITVTLSTTDVAIIKANTRLRQSNVWYNPGDGITTVTDGTGLEGAITEAALFIKGYAAQNVGDLSTLPPSVLVAEDGINAMITENGEAIVIE